MAIRYIDDAQSKPKIRYLDESAPQVGPPSAVKQGVSAVVRPIVKGVAGLPLMAMDAGVAARNVAGNAINAVTGRPATPDYQLPSQMFNESLDSLTVKPDSATGRVAEDLSSMLVGVAVPGPKGYSRSKAPDVGKTNPDSVVSVPANFRGDTSAMSGKQQLAERAVNKGFQVNPAEVNPTRGNRWLSAVAHQPTLEASISRSNAPVTEKLTKAANLVDDSMPLNRDSLQKVIEGQGNIYKQVRGAGEVIADDEYVKAIEGLPKRVTSMKSYGVVNTPAGQEAADLSLTLNQQAVTADDAVSMWQHLRDQAAAFAKSGAADSPKNRTNNQAVARVYETARDALKALIVRNLKAKGQDELAAQFDDAARVIAQAKTTQKAIIEGADVLNPAVLAQRVQAGKPTGGDMRLIGEMANTFPGVMQTGIASPPFAAGDISRAAGGGASAVASALTGNPSAAGHSAAWGGSLLGLRPLARAILMRQSVQNQMAGKPTDMMRRQALARALAGAYPSIQEQ